MSTTDFSFLYLIIPVLINLMLKRDALVLQFETFGVYCAFNIILMDYTFIFISKEQYNGIGKSYLGLNQK